LFQVRDSRRSSDGLKYHHRPPSPSRTRRFDAMYVFPSVCGRTVVFQLDTPCSSLKHACDWGVPICALDRNKRADSRCRQRSEAETEIELRSEDEPRHMVLSWQFWLRRAADRAGLFISCSQQPDNSLFLQPVDFGPRPHMLYVCSHLRSLPTLRHLSSDTLTPLLVSAVLLKHLGSWHCSFSGGEPKHLYHFPSGSRVSSNSVVSDYGLDDRAITVRSPAGAKDFSSTLCVQTGSGAHPASCTMGTGGPFPGGKARPGRDADLSPPSSAEVVNE
jgi:hypothetical protein